MKTCVIVGAGIAGLTAARLLQKHDWRVQIVDKGRNAGGRMATRRRVPIAFDHGAQFFTARSPEFRQEVEHWLAAGWVATWFGDPGRERYRSMSGMNGLATHLGEGLEIKLGVTVHKIAPAGGGWVTLSANNEPLYADAIILTTPVPQAIAMLGSLLTREMQTELARITYDPCIALLTLLTHPSEVPEPGYVRFDGDVARCLAVISDNTKKGISNGPAAITIHSTANFARTYWDTAPEVVAALMLEEARPFLGEPASGWQLHRWRYSQPATQYPSACFAVEAGAAPLILAGDAFGVPRVEGAYLSGLAAARKILV